MARNTYEGWIPEEYDSNALVTVRTVSAINQLAKRVPMGSDTKKVARAGGYDPEVILKGGTYPEGVNLNDTVILDAVKIGKAVRIAEEDIDDSFIDILNTTKAEYARSHGVFLDNAALAVSGIPNGGTIPFKSVYRSVTTADASTGYVANANLITTAGALTYDKLSALFGLRESGNFSGNDVVIAHPAFKSLLRGIKDTTGAPLFVANPRLGEADTLFGYPLVWSQGAKVSAVATANPTGNALLVVANSDFLLLGDRTPFETKFSDPRTGVATLSDEAVLQFRQRVAFTVGNPNAVAVLEITVI